MSGKLISKSVRLPQELVDYVMQQPGNDFSKKLVGILYEYWKGDEQRQLNLQRYDENIAARRSQYCELVAQINKLTVVKRRVDDLAKVVDVE